MSQDVHSLQSSADPVNTSRFICLIYQTQNEAWRLMLLPCFGFDNTDQGLMTQGRHMNKVADQSFYIGYISLSKNLSEISHRKLQLLYSHDQFGYVK